MRNVHGFTLIEVLIAGSLFLILSSGIIMSVLGSLENERFSEERVLATAYVEEGIEAMHSLKKRDFALLENTDGSGLVRGGDGLWELTGSEDVMGEYTRRVVIESVARNTEGDIVDHGGADDPKTKKVIVTVSWGDADGRPQSVELVGYFTDWGELF